MHGCSGSGCSNADLVMAQPSPGMMEYCSTQPRKMRPGAAVKTAVKSASVSVRPIPSMVAASPAVMPPLLMLCRAGGRAGRQGKS